MLALLLENLGARVDHVKALFEVVIVDHHLRAQPALLNKLVELEEELSLVVRQYKQSAHVVTFLPISPQSSTAN